MKGDTVLDLVEFQLTPPRTRCELFVSADGVTEKLASGFLKPFLNHLRGVEEQVAAGYESVRLERPQLHNGRSWFTKGTLERFVRFVSTPEILERVKSIEDELAQLEQVRNLQASSLLQVQDVYLGSESVFSQMDGKTGGSLGKTGVSDAPRRYPYDGVYSGTDPSKVELLRAMDVRVLALQQEQSTAFNRAAAAGFNSGNMVDLTAFSECFGADRLRVACLHFVAVSQKRFGQPKQHDSEEMSHLSSMPLPAKAGLLQDKEAQCHKVSQGQCAEDQTMNNLYGGLTIVGEEESQLVHPLSKGPRNMDTRKRWSVPENAHSQGSGDKHPEMEASSNNRLEGNIVSGSLNVKNPAKDGGDPFLKEGNVKTNSGNLSNDSFAPVSAPLARRLSVQDAISLFENKQRKESNEAFSKHWPTKQENGRTSLDGADASSSTSSMASRRCSTASGPESTKVLHKNWDSCKLSHEAACFDANKVGDMLLMRQGRDSPKLQLESLNALGTAPLQPSPPLPAVKPEDQPRNLDNGSFLQKGITEAVGVKEATTNQEVCMEVSGGVGKETTRRDNKYTHSMQPRLVRKNSISKNVAVEMNAMANASASSVSIANCKIEVLNSLSVVSASLAQSEGSREGSVELKVKSESPSDQSSGTKLCGSSSMNFHQRDMQNDARFSGPQEMGNDEHDSCKQRGRLYEHYRKVRDARLVKENDFKRAEREAKLRLLEETLLLRKAELEAQALKLSRSNQDEARAAKLWARKADFHPSQKDKEYTVGERTCRNDQGSSLHSISPLFIPVGNEESSTSKPHGGRKAAQRGTTPPRSSVRGTSVSPKLTPRSSMGSNPKPRKSVASVSDNPLAKSVPSFANLRKENTKPFAGRPSAGAASLQAKDGVSGLFRTAIAEIQPLEAHANVPFCTPSPGHYRPAKEEKLMPPSIAKRSSSVACDGKMPSSKEGVRPCPEGHKEGADPVAFLDSQGNATYLFEEPKQALNTLSSTSQVPHSLLPTIDVPKGADEQSSHQALEEMVRDNTRQKHAAEAVNMEIDDDDNQDVDQDSNEERNAAASFDGSCDDVQHKVEMDIVSASADDFRLEDDPLLSSNRAYWTSSFPNEMEHHAVNLSQNRDTSRAEDSSFSQELNGPLFDDNSGAAQQGQYASDAFMPFRASSLPHEHSVPVFSPAHASPSNTSVVRVGTISDHFSRSSAAAMESPFKSPASWITSQKDMVPGGDKRWMGSHKPAIVIPLKEPPAKGFKRLLKFARKNRTSDSGGSDWASTYASSEGDGMEERSDEGSHGARLGGEMAREHHSTQDQVSAAQFVRTSIPAPPANFELRDDHLTGGTMLKAPKSFFSLSSFRNRSNEGKAR